MPNGPTVTVNYPGGGKEVQSGQIAAPKPAPE